jgi:hypothetical protein
MSGPPPFPWSIKRIVDGMDIAKTLKKWIKIKMFIFNLSNLFINKKERLNYEVYER